LLVSARLTLTHDNPILLVDVPTRKQRRKKQYEKPKKNVPALNTQPISHGLKTPFNEFLKSFQSDFHDN